MTALHEESGTLDGLYPEAFIDLRDSAVAAAEEVPAEPLPKWHRWYVPTLVVLDAATILGAGLVVQRARFGTVHASVDGVPYLTLTVLATLLWLLTIAVSRGYDPKALGLGSEEFRRVANAAVRFTALLGVLAFSVNMNIARSLAAYWLLVAAVLVLGERYAARRLLQAVRQRGVACHKVLVVGEGQAAQLLLRRMAANPRAGMRVVGTWAPREDRAMDDVLRAIRACNADTLAVAHSASVTPAVLRRLAWTVEGAGVDLLVAPALTDVAGPRIHVRPVSGLPLLQVAPPEFSGARRVLKRTVDVLVTTVLLLLLAPLLLVTALSIRLTSRGPALFAQTRIGRDGRPFTMYKFRSMVPDAEQQRDDLLAHNEFDGGVLFKMRDDPRVTTLGRWLRRFSVDELPQLLNVLQGHMSLVGPRPPLPGEVEQYEHHVRRRFLVRPGLTGLWQVSGRSDLSWDEAVRLDLYYVENWSVAMDVEILWKTVFAVLNGSGAR